MIEIREARGGDFAKVHPLLQRFQNPNVGEAQWRQLFVDHSGLQNDVFGYVMTDGDEIVGFLGATLGERTIRGKKHRFCNLSNWIVIDEYRDKSVGLLSRAIEAVEQHATITVLSPSPHVLKLFQLLRFHMLDKSERILLPSPSSVWSGLWTGTRVLTDRAAVEASLGGELLTIFRNHQLPYNNHLLLETPEGPCYVLFNRSWKAVRGNLRLPFGRVHHISAPDVFVRHVGRVVASAMMRFLVAAVIVDERALRGAKVWHSVPRPGARSLGAFQSDELGPADIDGLYTEAVLLNY